MNTESLIMFLLFCVFLGGWSLFDHLKKHQRNQNIFKKVGWIADKKHLTYFSDNFRDEDLIYYIMNEQAKLKIPEKFRLDNTNETEKKFAEEILNLHKNDVVKSYFCDFLTKSKNICNLNSLEYYMFSLNCFLKQKTDYDYIYNDKIYTAKEYTDNSHFHCQLTDYGRACYKLYLITLLFVETNEGTRKCFEYISPKLKNDIMKYLDNNEVSFWTYRP